MIVLNRKIRILRAGGGGGGGGEKGWVIELKLFSHIRIVLLQ